MELEMCELTNPQRNILLLENFYKGTSVNNVCGTCIIHEPIDFRLLKRAIELVIENNDAYRIRFKQVDGSVLQYVDETYTLPKLEIIDVKTLADVDVIAEKTQADVFDIFSNSDNYTFKIFRFPNNHGGYVFNIHHLVADSWSLGLCAKEIARYYAILSGKTPENANEEDNSASKGECGDWTYIDYAKDELKYLSSDKFNKDEEFWNDIFSTVPEIAVIPGTGQHTANTAESKANRIKQTIPSMLVNLISDFCQRNQISSYNFFMAVFSIYIAKVSNTKDFVIGTPILNRTNYAQKHTFGMFVNTLPVRVNLSKNQSFIEYAKGVSLASMTMLRHQKYPYQKMLENARKLQADLPNLYSIMMSYQLTKTNADGLRYETRWEFNGNCADDVQIQILDLNDFGAFNIVYDYKIDKYSENDIEQMHKRVLGIIYQILSNENIEIADIEVATKSEKELLLNEFNNTDLEYDKNKTIVDLFEEQVKLHHDDIAIVCDGKKVTYAQLNMMANQLGNYLLKKGIGKDDLVGIMTHRSIEMVVGLIAILKVGSAYIPIDPCYPKERISYLIENSNSKAILVDKEVYDQGLEFANDNRLTINISLDNNKIYQDEDAENLNTEIDANSLMYLIYTSGSTGNPKGVMITHRNVNNFLNGMNQKINLKQYQNILSVTTMCFDIMGLELWGGLTNGLTVVVATDEEQNNVELLNKLCIENSVQIIQTTSSRMTYLLKDENYTEFLKNMKLVLIGGEAINSSIVSKILSNANVQIFNMYGPTETTIWSTCNKVIAPSDTSIGRPIANTKFYILDDNLNLLPPNVPGMLYLGGDGVSKGYFNLPNVTLERFVKASFKGGDDKLIYNTGDLAYYDETGKIYYMGRNDFQIKLRGYRIELGEIENSISKFTGIAQTAVIPHDNRLICYYVMNDGIRKMDEEELISFLMERLPDYMVPSEYVKLEQMPLTANGKIDRKSLSKRAENKLESEAPSTNTEKLLAVIVSRIINKNVENINEPFIAMGLDSLGIIQAQTELLSHNINVTTHQFYRYPTIKKLAEKIDKKISANTEVSSEVPEKFKHYPDEIIEKLATINVNENCLGNVFLTGANGFIGIHILHELIETSNPENKIFCLVRGENVEKSFEKLNKTYEFYFKKGIENLLGEKIVIINGDIAYKDLNMSEENMQLFKNGTINTIINAAAIVKHYGELKEFEKVNIEGTRNVTELAFENKMRLIQLSSISVSGNYLVKQNEKNPVFSENDLYIGQHYQDNNYVYSKMQAEKLILQYMNKGLTAQILRIGIVSGRYCDGIFQMDINSNAFYGRIKSIISMEAIPESMQMEQIEFTPVDLCAKAIVTLARNSVADNKIFNVYNHNLVTVLDILEALKKFGIDVNILGSKDFNDYILNLSQNSKESIRGIINDLDYDENHLLTVNYNYVIDIQSSYTTKYLHLLNFDWPALNQEYLVKVIAHMKDVGFIKPNPRGRRIWVKITHRDTTKK